MSGTPIDGDYIRAEGNGGRMGSRMMAIVAECQRGRIYLSPTNIVARSRGSEAHRRGNQWRDAATPTEGQARATLRTSDMELDNFCRPLHPPANSPRSTTLSDLGAGGARAGEGASHGHEPSRARKSLASGGIGATAYSEAVGVYLALRRQTSRGALQ